ncbi:hypothetical protein [Methanofollis fontis]|uniref:Uncharacterized protein n=1 Tax=Methanofollis fontis TaxID=2052832 RepID=A0A483CZA3_9EURY|nr:hypothetical protein [Methanofollis fontis]TAJ45662.1 hypothetical protein CUJ86_02800 [Methanofollis fontis]
MNLIATAVKKLEETVEHSGCEEGAVSLSRSTTIPLCQYPRGVCIEARFGDRRAHVVTPEPIQACTKVSFMFGAPLERPIERSAACAIINAVSGFFCINRRLNACTETDHTRCKQALAAELRGKTAFVAGSSRTLPEDAGIAYTDDPAAADVVLVTGPGLIEADALAAVEGALQDRRVIFLGPSTAGVAALLKHEHWCPYGH